MPLRSFFILLKLREFRVTQNETPKMVKISNCTKKLSHFFAEHVDESMSVIHFRTTAKGGLSHLSYILRKMEPLGTEFKTVAFSVPGAFLFIWIQVGKEGIEKSKYHLHLGAMTACTKRTTEAKRG